MAPVDEDETRAHLPPGGDGGRVTDHGDDQVLGTGGLDRSTPRKQGIEAARFPIDERLVVVLPAGLILL